MTESADMQDSISVLIKGLSDAEQKMLTTVMRLSVRRKPSLVLCEKGEKEHADVIIIDGKSPHAIKWAKSNQTLLDNKPVICIDSSRAGKHHVGLSRPVMWSNLPIVVSQAIDAFESTKVAIARPVSEPSTVAAKGAVSVLAVDDSKAVCDYVASALASQGIRVTTANSGEEALEIVNQRSDFSCVLMDVLMPGMDGYDACRMIKNKFTDMPVIMLTGKTSPFDRIRAKMAGCDAYITKPVNQQDLISKLQSYI